MDDIFYFYRKVLINLFYLDVIMLKLELKFHEHVREHWPLSPFAPGIHLS